jgi:hypothetical protein
MKQFSEIEAGQQMHWKELQRLDRPGLGPPRDIHRQELFHAFPLALDFAKSLDAPQAGGSAWFESDPARRAQGWRGTFMPSALCIDYQSRGALQRAFELEMRTISAVVQRQARCCGPPWIQKHLHQ